MTILPTLWQIVEDLAQGAISRRQAFILIKHHIRMAVERSKLKK